MRLDPSRILSQKEVMQVVADLKGRAFRNANAAQNLIIVRLACGLGLRRNEIVGLEVDDFKIGSQHPVVRIRRATAKGNRSRVVPLWWDQGTRVDLLDWIDGRKGRVVTKIARGFRGEPLTGTLVARRWKTAIKALGPARVHELSVHCGRHSFCTHAIMAGRSLMEVRDAAGHWDISTTDVYLHAMHTINNDARELYACTNPAPASPIIPASQPRRTPPKPPHSAEVSRPKLVFNEIFNEHLETPKTEEDQRNLEEQREVQELWREIVNCSAKS